jgi:tetratricopeptide (TPR) repeat protein
MTYSNDETTSNLEKTVARYQTTLQRLETGENLSSEEVLDVLIARDAVNENLHEKTQVSSQILLKIVDLDERLKQQTNQIVTVVKLKEWQVFFQANESQWWWFLSEKETLSSQEEKYNMIWDGLSIVSLTAFVAYMTSLVPRFAVGGLSIFESFGVVGPSSLMALALSSLNGGAGKKVINNILQQVGIPKSYHSLATFGVASLLLMGAIMTQLNLPKIANIYYKKGLSYSKKGLLESAEDQFQQALALDSENPKFHIALGSIYEEQGKIDEAKLQYQQALKEGDNISFNYLGYLSIIKKDFVTAEVFFRISLENVKEIKTKYRVLKNLGWSLEEQKKYDTAIPILQQAIALNKEIEKRGEKGFLGSGMAECFLGQSLTKKGETNKAQEAWKNCDLAAHPESIEEYKWLLEVAGKDINQTVKNNWSPFPKTHHESLAPSSPVVSPVPSPSGDK